MTKFYNVKMLQKKLLLFLLVLQLQITFAQQKTYLISEVATSPEFPGGLDMLKSFIATHFEMPEDANVFGQLELGFTVDTKGRLLNFEIIKDLGEGTGQEAIRVLANSPRWKPGSLIDGTAVNVYLVVPIKLQSR